MTPLAAAAILGFRSAMKLGGRPAVYRRDSDSVDICVLPGAQGQTDQSVAGSSSFNVATANWETETAKLAFDDVEITPAPGDTIDITNEAGAVESYQLAQGPNRRVWDWGEHYHQIRTLHTVPKPPTA